MVGAMETPVEWSVTAQNLPEHAGNPIHTDEGARAEGFPAALVAGVTTYAYLTRPLVAAWGLEWVRSGGAEVRFRAPVFAERTIDLRPTVTDDGVRVEAVDSAEDSNPRAIVDAPQRTVSPPEPRPGEPLPTAAYALAGKYGWDYGARAGDDLAVYGEQQVIHPAVWPALANDIFARELVRGPWIHTRSAIRHHRLVPHGATVTVESIVVDRFERRGERAIVDMVIAHEDRVAVTIEHEAIIDLG